MQGKRTSRRAPGPIRKKGIPRRRDQRPPPPADATRPPGTHAPNTRRRSVNRTPYGSHRHTPTSHRKPHRGRRAQLHGESELHPQRKPLGTPPRSLPPRPHRQATTPATTRATSQAPEEDEGTATAPRTRDRDPQRTRDHGTGPQGGRPHGHLPDPAARAAPADPDSMDPASHPHLTAPPSHQLALRTTTRARLTSTHPPRHKTRQHGTPHRSAPQCNATRQGTPKHNTPQHDATRRGTERHTTARHGAPRRGPAGRNATRHSQTRRSTSKHDTTQHGAPQHTTTPSKGR